MGKEEIAEGSRDEMVYGEKKRNVRDGGRE